MLFREIARVIQDPQFGEFDRDFGWDNLRYFGLESFSFPTKEALYILEYFQVESAE